MIPLSVFVLSDTFIFTIGPVVYAKGLQVNLFQSKQPPTSSCGAPGAMGFLHREGM